jgi:branched-chain amino acid transport system ATP-binding protein
VLLDEPSMGLSPIAIKDVIAAIERLSSFGLSVLIAEQNVNLALDVSSVCHVMQRGRIALTGTPDELRATPEIRRLYLGRGGDEKESA